MAERVPRALRAFGVLLVVVAFVACNDAGARLHGSAGSADSGRSSSGPTTRQVGPGSGGPAVPAAANGARELDRMLTDRPGLAEVLAQHPSLRAWMVTRLGASAPRVVWDATLPESGQPAEHLPPAAPGLPVHLRVATGWSGSDQLVMACFELLNVGNDPEIAGLWAKADAGSIERDELAAAVTQLELSALGELAALAKEHGLSPGPNDVMFRQLLASPTALPEYRVWVRQFGSYDAEAYYRRMFDERRAQLRAPGRRPPAPLASAP